MTAFSKYGKPCDLIINDRLLLPPNLLAEAAVEHMGDDDAFTFILYMDAAEKNDTVLVGDVAAFRQSWQRPKWDVMQK